MQKYVGADRAASAKHVEERSERQEGSEVRRPRCQESFASSSGKTDQSEGAKTMAGRTDQDENASSQNRVAQSSASISSSDAQQGMYTDDVSKKMSESLEAMPKSRTEQQHGQVPKCGDHDKGGSLSADDVKRARQLEVDYLNMTKVVERVQYWVAKLGVCRETKSGGRIRRQAVACTTADVW